MLDHYRRIIHNRASIEIVTQNVNQKMLPRILEMCPLDELNVLEKVGGALAVDWRPHSRLQAELWAWKWCVKCRARSPIRHLNTLVQNLSFAKYIDYLANAVNFDYKIKRPKLFLYC